MKERQSERVCMRFTPSEVEMLDALAEQRGQNRTDFVRRLVREAFHGTRFVYRRGKLQRSDK